VIGVPFGAAGGVGGGTTLQGEMGLFFRVAQFYERGLCSEIGSP
jgi:hypothetical protein